jgi:hypothetical protein
MESSGLELTLASRAKEQRLLGHRNPLLRIELRGREAVLRSEAEVGERALVVHVEDEPRHLAAADVEQVRSLPP